MSQIQSKARAVEALRFHAMPSKKKVTMAAGVRVGRVHVFVDAAGRVYSTQVKEHCCYTIGSGLEDTLEGCRLLGLLSKEAVAKHTADMRLRRAERERYYAADYFAANAKTLGLRLTDAQTKALAAARASGRD